MYNSGINDQYNEFSDSTIITTVHEILFTLVGDVAGVFQILEKTDGKAILSPLVNIKNLKTNMDDVIVEGNIYIIYLKNKLGFLEVLF